MKIFAIRTVEKHRPVSCRALNCGNFRAPTGLSILAQGWRESRRESRVLPTLGALDITSTTPKGVADLSEREFMLQPGKGMKPVDQGNPIRGSEFEIWVSQGSPAPLSRKSGPGQPWARLLSPVGARRLGELQTSGQSQAAGGRKWASSGLYLRASAALREMQFHPFVPFVNFVDPQTNDV